MMEFIQAFMENKIILLIGTIIGTFASIVLIYLYFYKNGRDERGRGIFATSSFIALCVYLVSTNLICGFSDEIFSNPKIVKSMIVHIYNLVLIVHIACTAILRKIR